MADGAAEISPVLLEVESISPGQKLSQVAYRRIKDALFAGRIVAGATVSQADLVEITGITLGAVREALQILEVEGLISILPRSGIQIVQPDIDLVRSAFQLREILERPALRRVAEAMPVAELDAFAAEHQAVHERAAHGQAWPELVADCRELDRQFHYRIIGFMRNKLLDRAYEWSFDRIRLIRLCQVKIVSASDIRKTMEEHLRIIEACSARDPQSAESAIEAHFANAMRRSLGL